MKDIKRVAEGLNLMYVGNIIAIAAALCTLLALLLPFLAFLTMIAIFVGGVVSLVGLFMLRDEHPSYMSALMACILGIVASLLSNNESTVGIIMSLARSIFSLLQVYFVIRGTNCFLEVRERSTEVAMGDRAWKWELASSIISVIAAVTAFILLPLALILSVAGIIVSIAALVFYLSYLKASIAALQ